MNDKVIPGSSQVGGEKKAGATLADILEIQQATIAAELKLLAAVVGYTDIVHKLTQRLEGEGTDDTKTTRGDS